MSIRVVMPRAGLTMVEGTISQWKAAEGSSVQKGTVLMEYENEKNSIEYEALDSGILHILAQEGDTVPVGGDIAVLAETPEEYAALCKGGAPAGEAAPAEAAAAPAVPAPAAPVGNGAHIRATGFAKKLAKEAGISLADVPPTGGPDGLRIVAKDVTAYLEQRRSAAPVCSAEQDVVTETPWNGIRKVIARNMMDSLQQSAQCTSVCELDVTELLSLRQSLVEQQDFLGCKITVNDLLCMAVVKMLKKHPLVNGTFDGKTLFSHKFVNLTVAVATEGGLMVPVVRHADGMSLVQLSQTIKDLGARARDKQLRDGEQAGGTFTVSNVGMFPIDLATPILNPPEVGIMGFGRTAKKPVYVYGQFVPRDKMNAFFTFDHRVVDGLEVGRVFQDLQTLIEHPSLILA